MLSSIIDAANRAVGKTMPCRDYSLTDAETRCRWVAPCLIRFARGELAGERLGRIGSVAVFPALGESIKLKLEDSGRADALALLVVRGLAIGYVFTDRALEAGGDDAFVERDAEASWNAWTERLNIGFLEASGMPAETLSVLRKLGSSVFPADAREAGLKGRVLKRIGGYYAQAGAELRMVQSQPELVIGPSAWAYGDFPSK